MTLEVDKEISMNKSLTTCCGYLIATNPSANINSVTNSGFRNGSCLFNSKYCVLVVVYFVSCCFLLTGMEYCCVDKAELSNNVSRIDFVLPTALQNSTSCCSALNTREKFSMGDNYTLASGIYYRIINDKLDLDSPKNGFNSTGTKLENGEPDFIPGNYYSGCNVNMINKQIQCRFRPTYQLSPYADKAEQIVYYRTMMARLLFAGIFEVSNAV